MDVRVERPKAKPFVGTSTTIATRYWCSSMVQHTSAATAMSANREYAQPFNLPGLTIDRIGVNVTVGGNNLRIGLYSNANGVPGDLLLDAGIIDVSGTGSVEATIAAMVLPEWIWVAGIFEGTPTVTVGVGLGASVGFATPGTAVKGIISSGAQAYGALPAAFPAMAFVGSAPMFTVRKS